MSDASAVSLRAAYLWESEAGAWVVLTTRARVAASQPEPGGSMSFVRRGRRARSSQEKRPEYRNQKWPLFCLCVIVAGAGIWPRKWVPRNAFFCVFGVVFLVSDPPHSLGTVSSF